MEQRKHWQQPDQHPGKGADPGTVVAHTTKKKLEREADAGDDDLNEDATEIISNSAAFADRDQVFKTNKRPPPPSIEGGHDEGWEGENQEALLGNRESDTDLLEEIEDLTKTFGSQEQQRIHLTRQIPTPPTEFDLGLDKLDDAQLHSRAHALGVPDSDRMNRHELILVIRQTLLDGLEEVIG